MVLVSFFALTSVFGLARSREFKIAPPIHHQVFRCAPDLTNSWRSLACKLASLALNLAATNKQRHPSIQNFFLINDSTTIAAEMPIYLTNWDAGYYRNQKGFIFPLNSYTTPITGHIDILQIRNGLIHILDYKSGANKQKPIEQLTIYALALSRKLNLPLYYFKCAWFDENSYFEFFPLHAVYKTRENP